MVGICLLVASPAGVASPEAQVTVVGVGVPEAALQWYRRAASDSLRFYATVLRAPLTHRITIRVFGASEQYIQALTKYGVTARTLETSGAWAGDREILVNDARLRTPDAQYRSVAHELTHQWQIEVAGFDRVYSDRAWKSCWMAEGHASYLTLLMGDGHVTNYAEARTTALQAIRAALPFSLADAMGNCGEFRPLEWRVGAGAAYGKAMLAVEGLITQKGHLQVSAYFRGLRRPASEPAFAAAFGVSMRSYLEGFERRLVAELNR